MKKKSLILLSFALLLQTNSCKADEEVVITKQYLMDNLLSELICNSDSFTTDLNATITSKGNSEEITYETNIEFTNTNIYFSNDIEIVGDISINQDMVGSVKDSVFNTNVNYLNISNSDFNAYDYYKDVDSYFISKDNQTLKENINLDTISILKGVLHHDSSDKLYYNYTVLKFAIDYLYQLDNKDLLSDKLYNCFSLNQDENGYKISLVKDITPYLNELKSIINKYNALTINELLSKKDIDLSNFLDNYDKASKYKLKSIVKGLKSSNSIYGGEDLFDVVGALFFNETNFYSNNKDLTFAQIEKKYNTKIYVEDIKKVLDSKLSDFIDDSIFDVFNDFKLNLNFDSSGKFDKIEVKIKKENIDISANIYSLNKLIKQDINIETLPSFEYQKQGSVVEDYVLLIFNLGSSKKINISSDLSFRYSGKIESYKIYQRTAKIDYKAFLASDIEIGVNYIKIDSSSLISLLESDIKNYLNENGIKLVKNDYSSFTFSGTQILTFTLNYEYNGKYLSKEFSINIR